MKNVINWTFGGFFRSLGRIICYIVIGGLFMLLLSSSNIKLPSWLKIMRVNAATTTSWSTAQVKVGTCHDDDCSYGSNVNTPTTFSGSDLNYPVYSLRWRVRSSNGLSSENSYTFSVAYKPNPDSLHFKQIYLKGNGDVSRENATCVSGVDSSNYITYKCTFTPIDDYSSSDYLYITIDFYMAYQTSLATKISKYEERVGTNAIITQQTEKIDNTLNDIENVLTDTDTSQDSTTASDFFHNFNLSLEGPISQIVLLPINMLQYLIVDYNSDSTHNDLCTTFKGKQICLPSGDILWKRSGCHDNSPFGCPNYTNFRLFFQLVVGGFIYYKLCRKLVNTAEKGLDPQESGVNMLKL